MQGHRRRRRKIRISVPEQGADLTLSEYKTIRQYQSFGDLLDEFRTYGFQAGLEHVFERDRVHERENGHYWLTWHNDE